jgi:hypothetical protein
MDSPSRSEVRSRSASGSTRWRRSNSTGCQLNLSRKRRILQTVRFPYSFYSSHLADVPFLVQLTPAASSLATKPRSVSNSSGSSTKTRKTLCFPSFPTTPPHLTTTLSTPSSPTPLPMTPLPRSSTRSVRGNSTESFNYLTARPRSISRRITTRATLRLRIT